MEEALAVYKEALQKILVPETEEIPVTESLNRITKTAVYAKYCSPLYNAAAMDGIAVKAERTKGATERQPLTLKAGEDFGVVDTGDPIHMPYDAVIMAEEPSRSSHTLPTKSKTISVLWRKNRART